VSEPALVQRGKKKWHRDVFDVVERLTAAIEPDYVIVGGGGGVDKLDELPPNCRRGDNKDAFLGGFRLREDEWIGASEAPPAAR
jgi:polyphosphate glucokinase